MIKINMSKYLLWIDPKHTDKSERERTEELLQDKGIDYRVIECETDGDWNFPCLLIPEGRCEGFHLIQNYIQTTCC